MGPVDNRVKADLDRCLCAVEDRLAADAVAFIGPIMPGREQQLRMALDSLGSDRRPALAVILDTPGGIVEVVERVVTTIRFMYSGVTVIVPDQAMSAGTIFALSADRIMMDHLSCLGPIDPQIEKDGRLVPALSYQFEQARALSNELLIKWLSTYKFRDWKKTETRGLEVTLDMKEERARAIATLLNNPERWHSHGRAIDRKTLREEVDLKIDDLEADQVLYSHIRDYFGLLNDYMRREKWALFIHSRGYF